MTEIGSVLNRVQILERSFDVVHSTGKPPVIQPVHPFNRPRTANKKIGLLSNHVSGNENSSEVTAETIESDQRSLCTSSRAVIENRDEYSVGEPRNTVICRMRSGVKNISPGQKCQEREIVVTPPVSSGNKKTVEIPGRVALPMSSASVSSACQRSRIARLYGIRSRSPALVRGMKNLELKRNLGAASVVMEEEKASGIGSSSSSRSSLSNEELGTIAQRALQLSVIAAESKPNRRENSPLMQLLKTNRIRKVAFHGNNKAFAIASGVESCHPHDAGLISPVHHVSNSSAKKKFIPGPSKEVSSKLSRAERIAALKRHNRRMAPSPVNEHALTEPHDSSKPIETTFRPSFGHLMNLHTHIRRNDGSSTSCSNTALPLRVQGLSQATLQRLSPSPEECSQNTVQSHAKNVFLEENVQSDRIESSTICRFLVRSSDEMVLNHGTPGTELNSEAKMPRSRVLIENKERGFVDTKSESAPFVSSWIPEGSSKTGARTRVENSLVREKCGAQLSENSSSVPDHEEDIFSGLDTCSTTKKAPEVALPPLHSRSYVGKATETEMTGVKLKKIAHVSSESTASMGADNTTSTDGSVHFFEENSAESGELYEGYPHFRQGGVSDHVPARCSQSGGDSASSTQSTSTPSVISGDNTLAGVATNNQAINGEGDSLFLNLGCAIADSLDHLCKLTYQECNLEGTAGQQNDKNKTSFRDERTTSSEGYTVHLNDAVSTQKGTGNNYATTKLSSRNMIGVDTATEIRGAAQTGLEWNRRYLQPKEEASLGTKEKTESILVPRREKLDFNEERRQQAREKLLGHAAKAVSWSVLQPSARSEGDQECTEILLQDPNTLFPAKKSYPLRNAASEIPRNNQTSLAAFSYRLRNPGIKVLKLGRKRKWQSRHLTVSRHPEGSGLESNCPSALVWLKEPPKKVSVNFKEGYAGRGGFLFSKLVHIDTGFASSTFVPSIPKKWENEFSQLGVGLVCYSMRNGSNRSLIFCFTTEDEAGHFRTAMQIVKDAAG